MRTYRLAVPLFVIVLAGMAVQLGFPTTAEAGDPTFLWKPKSDSDGKLAILFPAQYRLENVTGASLVGASGQKERSSRVYHTGVNGDRIHARFSKSGSGYGGRVKVILSFKDGSTRGWSVPNGAQRYETRDGGAGGTGGGEGDNPGSLDDVLRPGGTREGTLPVSLNASNQGEVTVELKESCVISATANLATYGPASLSVRIESQGKAPILWLSWERQDDHDGNPLQVDGIPREDSIFMEGPGDPSSKAVTVQYECIEGDRLIISLKGSFGPAQPSLDVSR